MGTALVTGINGQTGSYLSEILLEKGWEVHGISVSEDSSKQSFSQKAKMHYLDLADSQTLYNKIQEIRPSITFNLAAVSSVAESWANPHHAKIINDLAVSVMLKALRDLENKSGNEHRFVQASSAEIFGNPSEQPQNELTPINPINPYGASKAAAHFSVKINRIAGYWSSNCILYNHESVRRPTTFVTRKITEAVARIHLGKQKFIELGNIEILRDWGWAPDYATAMFLVGTNEDPDDYIVSTGRSHSISELLQIAFETIGIQNWPDYVITNNKYFRPMDAVSLVGDPGKIQTKIGWQPTVSFQEMIAGMVTHDINAQREENK